MLLELVGHTYRAMAALVQNWIWLRHYRAVAFAHGGIAALHLGYLAWIIGCSAREKKMVFGVTETCSSPNRATKTTGWSQGLYRVYYALSSRSDLFSVNSPYFDVVLLCREIVETALQTQQAYRMSLLLPRAPLNRGYAALLILNCWSTALIYSIFQTNAPQRRLIATICDCVLDLVSSVGISSVLLLIYATDFDFALNQFPANKWYEDVWVVHAMSEFQIILVMSWSDLVMRMIFALSMISNMNNMKKLLATHQKSLNLFSHRVTAVIPLHPSTRDKNVDNNPHVSLGTRKLRVEARFAQVMFAVWVLAILVLHSYADTIPEISQCKMQVKPWFTSRPSCSLLMLNCHESRVDGREKEVTDQWSSFDPTTTVRLVIHHCPVLEIPSDLTRFSSLKVLKISIASWEEAAALSQKCHPDLVMVFIVRVNMADGQLPIGLQSADFPHSLNDIEFCVTNLHSLPDDSDLKWPQSASIYFEACHLTEVPESLARLAPYDLSIAMNPIRSIPSSIIEGNVGYLHLGGTLISELPRSVSNVHPWFKLRVDNTQVGFFWDWIGPVVAGVNTVISDIPTILAANSPYCGDLQQIFAGNQTIFSTPQHEHQSELLSDASRSNWEKLQAAVSCEQ